MSVRGIFERPVASGIWWISYFQDGKHRREKMGTKQAAIDGYRSRKAAILEGRKLPEKRPTKAPGIVTLSDLIDLALEFTADHKDVRSYVTKAAIVREALGDRPAAEITPQELTRWLKKHTKSPATFNRYKSFVSLCYREGIANSKVSANPARLVRQAKEPKGRSRFLDRDEYQKLLALVPQGHRPSLIASINTGMRLSEQFTLTWSQVHLERKSIELDRTKNGSGRVVRLNAHALTAFQQLAMAKHKAGDRVFPQVLTAGDFGIRTWFAPAVREAELEGVTWHILRHTFCSWLAMAGATIKDIQDAAGHKTITMSARYSHLSPEHSQSVVDRLD